MELKHILTKGIQLQVMWLEEPFDFEYSPAGYEETLHSELARVSDLPDSAPDKIAVSVEILTKMLVSWTLTEDGKVMPLTKPNVGRLPPLLRGAMVNELMADLKVKKRIRGGPNSAVPSLLGSNPVEQEVAVQNGIGVYELPEDWGAPPGNSSDAPTSPVVSGGDTGTN